MAVISRDFKKFRRWRWFWGILSLIFVPGTIWFFFAIKNWHRMWTVLFVAIDWLVLKYFFGFQSGHTLEARVTKVLKTLPDNCYVIQDLNLELNKKSMYFFHIVLCPAGIFFIESRHRKGKIVATGDTWEHYWARDKDHFPNPVMKADEKLDFLEDWMEENSTSLFDNEEQFQRLTVEPLIVFTSDELELQAVGGRVPILKMTEFEKYTHVFTRRRRWSDEQIVKFKDLLLNPKRRR